MNPIPLRADSKQTTPWSSDSAPAVSRGEQRLGEGYGVAQKMCRLNVSDLAALVLHVQRVSGGVLNDLCAVRQAVDGLAVLDGLDQGGGGCLPLGAAHAGRCPRHFALRYSH
jgi:hypothetical protein